MKHLCTQMKQERTVKTCKTLCYTSMGCLTSFAKFYPCFEIRFALGNIFTLPLFLKRSCSGHHTTHVLLSYFYLLLLVVEKLLKQSSDFTVPVARILGESEIYLDAGSTINITCVVKHTPVPPSHVQWEHQGKVRPQNRLLFLVSVPQMSEKQTKSEDSKSKAVNRSKKKCSLERYHVSFQKARCYIRRHVIRHMKDQCTNISTFCVDDSKTLAGEGLFFKQQQYSLQKGEMEGESFDQNHVF